MTPAVLHAISAGGAGVAVCFAIWLMMRFQTAQAERRMEFERERSETSRVHFDQLQESHAERIAEQADAHAERLEEVAKDYQQTAGVSHANQAEATKAIKEQTRVGMATNQALGKLEGILTTMAGQQARSGPGMASGEHPAPPAGPTTAPEPAG